MAIRNACWAASPPTVAKDLAARAVLIGVSRQRALAQLKQYRFAAAVDSLRVSVWLAGPSGTSGRSD